MAAGPQQPRSTSGIKPALTFGPRRILNNSEQKIALKTIFCAKPVTVMSNAYGKIIANVEQLHRLMDEEGISAIVARSGKNFTYLAGFAYPGTLARQGEHNLSFHKE